MPSLEPAATEKLWRQLVQRRRPLRVEAGCRPLRAVFYTDSDWVRMATKLAANASPCAQYSISIPPLAADKTAFRGGQAGKIRALGPSFHALAEISYTGWSRWVAATGATWLDAGIEARRRMAAAGFDVARGDSWAVNELSSAVRANQGAARQSVRDLLHGLYDGGGSLPPARGVVFVVGLSQTTPDLTAYKIALQSWYLDSAFWQEIGPYVSDWSQEVYGDVRSYAVAGAPPSLRAEHLNDFLGHELALADAAPPAAQAAKDVLRSAYSPLANAAWAWDDGFGFTNVPLAAMQDYVTAQTYAVRAFDLAHGLPQDQLGFAWAPRMPGGGSWTADYTTQTGQLLDRIAAAIHDSDQAPEGACGASWCTASLPGSSFVETWKTFASWAQSALAFATPPATLAAGTVSPPLTVQLQGAGAAQNTGVPLVVTLTSSSPSGAFAPGPDGPWTPTLVLTIPAGASGATFSYRDTAAGSPTLAATIAGQPLATQQEQIVAAPLVALAVTPPVASVEIGRPQVFATTGTDAYGNVVPGPAAGWTLAPAAPGTLSPASGASATFAATAPGTATITATAGGLTATAQVVATKGRLRVASVAYARRNARLRVTVRVVDAAGHAVRGARVTLRVLRGTRTFASASGRTGSAGRLVTAVREPAPAGCYSTRVGVSAPAFVWSGVVTRNRTCFRR